MVRRSSERAQFDVTLASKVLVSLLFAVALVAAVPDVLAGDFDSLATTAASLYVTGTLAVGVFYDATDTQRWRLAFYGGLVAFGAAQYVASGERLGLLLFAAGVVMVLWVAFDAFVE